MAERILSEDQCKAIFMALIEARDQGMSPAQSYFSSQPGAGARTKPRRAVLIEQQVEDGGENDPHRTPSHRLANAYRMRAPVKHAKVERQHRQDEDGEAEIEPPVVGERKKGHIFRLRNAFLPPSIDISATTIRFRRPISYYESTWRKRIRST